VTDSTDLVRSRTTADYMAEAASAATRRAYLSDWRDFAEWADGHGRTTDPADPQTVADYLTDLANRGYRASTISRRVSAISKVHDALGHPSPTRTPGVRQTLRGIRRTLGTAPSRKAEISSDDLRAYFAGLGDGLKPCRDRALLVWGFAGGFRRSELVALEVSDLEATPEGYRVTVRRSKTDQTGEGFVKAITYGQDPATCPVRLMRSWLEVSGITDGAVFRGLHSSGGSLRSGPLSGQSVANIVKACARALGKDPAGFAGHSLRAGFVTEAARAGASERAIANQTGHRSPLVLRGYIRRATIFEDNAVSSLGL